MRISEHLLYLDITNKCDLDCGFCMYGKEREQILTNLKLNQQAKDNLNSLINDEETDHIIISGEGEPFNNEPIIWDLLNLSKGKNKIQIITNGKWLKTEGNRILTKLNYLASKKEEEYSIRLSFDKHHFEKVKLDNYLIFLQAASKKNQKYPNINFTLRSLVEDKDFVIEKLSYLLDHLGNKYEIKDESILDQAIIFPDSRLSINYKNLINPNISDRNIIFSIWDYMRALENKYKKYFTFGNLRTNKSEKGLDITIKPNGDLFFYGLEVEPHANISIDHVNMPLLNQILTNTPLLNTFYTVPFIDVLHKLSEDSEIKNKIESINNPYWIIKELYPQYKEQFDVFLNLK